jgi:hypothetical protein
MWESQFIQAFFSVPMVCFVLGIAIVIYVVRNILEKTIPSLKTATWFQEIVLPYSPILVGILLAISMKNYAFPMMTLSGRALSGLIGGAFSDFAYNKIKIVLAA